mmetsp:Transcript_79823/g.162446  ORF Transcript_79823/g.162446 Transcript_79823/m.162446 type:complete len:213 (+) Transcript_79823:723-1361(+)
MGCIDTLPSCAVALASMEKSMPLTTSRLPFHSTKPDRSLSPSMDTDPSAPKAVPNFAGARILASKPSLLSFKLYCGSVVRILLPTPLSLSPCSLPFHDASYSKVFLSLSGSGWNKNTFASPNFVPYFKPALCCIQLGRIPSTPDLRFASMAYSKPKPFFRVFSQPKDPSYTTSLLLPVMEKWRGCSSSSPSKRKVQSTSLNSSSPVAENWIL